MQELETGPLHRFRDWPNEQVPSGRRRLHRRGWRPAAGCRHEWPRMVAEDLEVGAEHAAPARRHEAMLAKA